MYNEIVREKILADDDREYQDYVPELEAKKNLSEIKRSEMCARKLTTQPNCAKLDALEACVHSHNEGGALLCSR